MANNLNSIVIDYLDHNKKLGIQDYLFFMVEMFFVMGIENIS